MEVSEVSNRILSGMLEARTGQQLAPRRRWRIGSALSGLFREHGVESVDQLIALLTQSREASLARKVVEALLNNETYFFRDRAMFDLLTQRILPELAERRAATRRLAIWSAGCSTGQELLSLAMILAEQEQRWAGWTFDLVGTDVSQSVIELARKGTFTQFQIQRGLGVAQMLKWFNEVPEGWQADDRLRRMMRFEVHNLLDAPPAAARFDLVLCRNVLLYFEGPTRGHAFERLENALAPDGWLMLGAGETVIGQTERFVPAQGMSGLYTAAASAAVPPSQFQRRAG
jgi:chemotaxis protein methyltransferase CheR